MRKLLTCADFSLAVLRFHLRKLVKDERGAQTIEYIALGILSLALIGAIASWLNSSGSGSVGQTFGNTINAIMQKIQQNLNGSGN